MTVKQLKQLLESYPEDMVLDDKTMDLSFNAQTIPKACQNCANHPSNGGSGICHCILGSMDVVTY